MNPYRTNARPTPDQGWTWAGRLIAFAVVATVAGAFFATLAN